MGSFISYFSLLFPLYTFVRKYSHEGWQKKKKFQKDETHP